MNGTNILIEETLACRVSTPLDGGESILPLCQTIQHFMPENFMPAMATIAACLMGANYLSILKVFGWLDPTLPHSTTLYPDLDPTLSNSTTLYPDSTSLYHTLP